jgi:hypothetical protein
MNFLEIIHQIDALQERLTTLESPVGPVERVNRFEGLLQLSENCQALQLQQEDLLLTAKSLAGIMDAGENAEDKTEFLDQTAKIALNRLTHYQDLLGRISDRIHQNKMIFCLDSGKALCEEGKIRDALDIWKCLLVEQPHNEDVHRIFKDIIEGRFRNGASAVTPDTIKFASAMRKRYYLKHQKNLGLNGQFTSARYQGITHVGKKGNNLLVCAAAPHIIELNPNNYDLRELAIPSISDRLIVKAEYCRMTRRLYVLAVPKKDFKPPVSVPPFELLVFDGGFQDPANLKSETFADPRAIGIAIDGKLAVADISQKRIQIFDPDLKPIKTISNDTVGNDIFNTPNSIVFDGPNDLLICDQSSSVVIKWDLCHDRMIWMVKFPEHTLKGMAIDREGNGYVAKFGSNKLYKLNAKGEIVFSSKISTEACNGVSILHPYLAAYDKETHNLCLYSIDAAPGSALPEEWF